MQVSVTFLTNPMVQDSLRVDKKLGQGKFQVFQVYSASRRANYALKVFPTSRTGTALFLKEQHLDKLNHPNIIKQVPVKCHHNDFHAQLTELAKFGDFFEVVENSMLSNMDILIRTYFHQLIEATQHMHTQGVAHLDLKLENLMLGTDFQLKVIDFDQSQLLNDQTATSRGTKGYRAPELIKGACSNLTAADIYSIGVILYTLKSEEFPFLEQEEGANGADDLDSIFHFNNDNENFWKNKAENKDDNEFFSDDFIELVNGLLENDAEKRWTIEDIKASKWYNGKILDDKDLKSEMRPRWNHVNKLKEQKNQISY